MHHFLFFCLTVLLLALSPGPNWAYLISRSLSQGKRAGLLSLLGTLTAFLFYMLLTALGLSMVFKTVPALYFILKIGGGIYLLWLAWNAVKPNAVSMFDQTTDKNDSDWTLYKMGLLTNLLNPKTAVFYLAIFPAFMSKGQGSVFSQTIILGLTQIIISFLVNLLVIWSASLLAGFLRGSSFWKIFQKWFTGSVLAFLGIKMLLEKAR
jgi:threonine/homoserine/homoserine lactone efflux protein